jgi:hypothetical protein
MNRILIIALCAASISVPAFANSAPEEAKVYSTRPVGDGNPSSISCYLMKSSLGLTKLCKTNAEWARIQTSINERASATSVHGY